MLGISLQLLIRKHSYLGHGSLGESASLPYVLAPGFIPQGGVGGKKLGVFSFILTSSKDIVSEVSHPHDIGFCALR